MALDERLRRELERSAHPADPSGVYEDLIRRRERRRMVRRLQRGALAVGVIVGCVAGVVALSRVFGPADPDPIVGPSPMPITPHENGRIAYSLSTDAGMELHTVSPDGSADRIVPTPPGMPWLPAWSPDGSQLAVAVFPTDGRDRAIWVLNADGSAAHRVAAAANVSVPSWSPDGSTIAYAARTDGRTEIHLVAPDGSDDRAIHGEDAAGTFAIFSAQFSPDGREILFDRGTDSGFDIFVMNVDGSDVRRLTTTGSDYDPHWSPDGSKIAFTRQGEGAQSDVYVMTADGTDVRQLTDGGEGVTSLSPQWSPDGTKIAYVAGVTGGPGPLVIMNPDGSDPATLVRGDVLGLAWQPLAVGSGEPTPSPTPEPTQTGEDIGLGFPVCDVTAVAGEFAPGVAGTAYVATKKSDVGGCPNSGGGGAFQVLAVDVTGDGLADADAGPLVCDPFCTAFAAADVDGDGTDELFIQNVQFSIAGLRLYDVRAEPARVTPVTVSTPGYPDGGLPPGAEPQFWVGGDGFQLDTLRCIETPDARVPRALVQTSASQVPPDSSESVWQATRTWFALDPDGTVAIVDVGTFDEPVGQRDPTFAQGDDLCGAPLPAPYGGT